jgi:hypothetical protein
VLLAGLALAFVAPGVAFVAPAAAVVAPAAAVVTPAAAAEPSAAEVDRRLSEAAQKLEVVVEQSNGLRVELRRSAARAAALRARIAPLEREADERSGEIGAVAAAAYRAGTGSPVFGLLAAGTPCDLAQRLALLEHLGRAATGRSPSYMRPRRHWRPRGVSSTRSPPGRRRRARSWPARRPGSRRRSSA